MSSSSHAKNGLDGLKPELRRDTGYRAVPPGVGNKEYDEDYLDSLPHCPAFKGMHVHFFVCVMGKVH